MTEVELFVNVFIALPLGVILGLWLVYLCFGEKPFLNVHEGRDKRLAEYLRNKELREWQKAERS